MSSYFTIDLTDLGGGSVQVKLSSVNAYKGTVSVSYSYEDSPSPIPEISPTSDSLYVPCNGSVTDTVSVGETTGWTFDAEATDGTLTDGATLLI